MAPAAPPLPDPAAICIPYAAAAPHQIFRALTRVVEEPAQHSPTLSFASWTAALIEQRPNLWVEQENVFLEENDLIRLTQRLAASPELTS